MFVGATWTAAGGVASPATPVATRADCPVTAPNEYNTPPDMQGADFEGGYGNDALWTNVWMWGEGWVPVDPEHVQADGSLGDLKWAWYRFVPGKLTIEGRRLDGPADPLRAEIPDGYGDIGFQVSGLTFPTGGCWEVTGRVADASLTFVTWVEQVNWSGTPVASPVPGS